MGQNGATKWKKMAKIRIKSVFLLIWSTELPIKCVRAIRRFLPGEDSHMKGAGKLVETF